MKMKHLFADRKVYDLTGAYISSLDSRVKKLSRTDFEKSTIDELTAKIKEEFDINVPTLLKDKIYTKQPKDIKISVGKRTVYGGSSSQVDGTEYVFVIPFSGDPYYLNITPSSFLSVLPYGNTNNNEIIISYEVPNNSDPSGLRAEFDRNLETLEKYLEFLDSDFKLFNSKLENTIKTLVERRKAKLDNDDETASGFGFPVKS
jgi:hypothetical protein